MIVGILKEIKAEENRVAMSPGGVEVLIRNGHTVMVEKNAGQRSGWPDDAYAVAGAQIVDFPRKIFEQSEMIVRVKEPQPAEFEFIQEGQIFFNFFHLAASEKLTKALIQSGAVCIAYETIQKTDGSLPLLIPMSEVAGSMAIHEGAKYLEMAQGGFGVLLGGVPGVDPGTVVIIGGGMVGINAAKMACGVGAKVYIFEIDLERMRYLSDVMPSNCFLHMSSPKAIRELLPIADLVVGAVLIPGSKTPHVVTGEMVRTMKPGSVLVDVSIDQGGCFETSKETTHSDPTYILDGVVHYAVSNMPGAVPKTSSVALTNASLLYAVEIANKGWKQAMKENSEIKHGANVVNGEVTYRGVADALGLEYTPVDSLL